MRILSIAAAILAAGFVSQGAFAQAFVGASAGQVRVNIDCTGTDTCDKSDTALKVFGGYMFTPNFGLEAAYYDQGKLRQTATDVELGKVSAEWRGNGYGLFGVAALPLGDASVFGKLGAVSTKIKVSGTSSNFGTAQGSERHTNLGWGLGAGYNFTTHLRGRVEFEQVKVKFQEESRNARLFTVGLLYSF